MSLLTTIPTLEAQLVADMESGGIVCTGRHMAGNSGQSWDPAGWHITSWFRNKWWFMFDKPLNQLHQWQAMEDFRLPQLVRKSATTTAPPMSSRVDSSRA